MRSSDAIQLVALQNALQDIAEQSPDRTITATGMSGRTGIDIATVRVGLARSVEHGLLEAQLVAKCQMCGGEHDIDDVEEIKGAICEGACAQRSAHRPFVVFRFTPDILKLVEGRRRPKVMRRLRAPLLNTITRKMLQIIRDRVMNLANIKNSN